MTINIKDLPEWAKLEVKKADLQAFAEAIMKEVSAISSQQSESDRKDKEDGSVVRKRAAGLPGLDLIISSTKDP
jgi:hypothetical protein